MLAKLTSKNQLTLPKAVTLAVGASEYFDVQTRDGVIVLTPVRIQRADAVRAKLAELALDDRDIEDAVAWARHRVAEPETSYPTKSTQKAVAKATQKPRQTGKRKP